MKKRSIRSIPMLIVSGVLMVISLLIMLILPASAASATLLGDVNGDGAVKTIDARLALRYAIGLDAADSLNVANADWDNNGDISLTDSRNILRYALGIQEYPEWYKEEDAPSQDPQTKIPDEHTTSAEPPTQKEDYSDRATFYETFISRDTGREIKNVWICNGCGKRLLDNGNCPTKNCKYYNEKKDASKYCQVCGLPTGYGPGRCAGQPVFDVECARCGELIKKGTCHPNCKNNIITGCPYCQQEVRKDGICNNSLCD
ncbi:MAG TPA: hypothetical protein GXZ23_06825, partial [Clostridiales bacterium]|nr:hypothetical protein [Clostridiales bacterium]